MLLLFYDAIKQQFVKMLWSIRR